MERLEIIAIKARQLGMSVSTAENMIKKHAPSKVWKAYLKRSRRAEKRLANG